jgi:hypothetical protein
MPRSHVLGRNGRVSFTREALRAYVFGMGAGRGRSRRVWLASGNGPRAARLRLDAVPSRRPAYARYREVFRTRAMTGTAFAVYSVEEYAVAGDHKATARYCVVVEDSEVFWAATVRALDAAAQPGRPSAFARATYRRRRPNKGLRNHHGDDCVVYAVEQHEADHPFGVSGRCGVRFVGEDAYWVVPAVELDIGPLVAVPSASRR